MVAAVLSIGSELTRGELDDTNAAWLAERMTSLGFDVHEHVTVDDDRARIAAAIQRLAGSAGVVLATGGLGPTTDDVTSEAVAAAVGVPLVRDEGALQRLRQRWAAYGRPMPRANEKQADLPRGAVLVPNELGTAPGYQIEWRGTRFYFLPGVPIEMQHMFRETVRKEIAALVRRTSYQVRLRTFGLPESEIGDRLRDLESSDPAITLGYRVTFPEIEVKVLARGEDGLSAEARARAVAERVRTLLGDAVFGEGDVRYPEAVGRILRDRGLTLALAESCTGGLVGSLVTSVPGSSNYLLFDAVTYSNASKERILGVSSDVLRAHGAVSSECARAMAEGALRLCDADLSVAVTGIAGPGGATEEKPIGTVWLALARRGGPTVTRLRRLHGDRDRVRTLAAYVALKMVADAAEGRELVPGVPGSAPEPQPAAG